MNIRRIMALFLAAILQISVMATAFAAEPDTTVQGRLTAIENVLYGSVQTGALLDRINRVEKDFDGTHPASGVSMVSRVDTLYEALFDNTASPSVLTQLNAIEWGITHQVSMDSVQSRIATMEKTIQGSPKEGTFRSRIATLSGYAFGSATVPLSQVTVPANTLLKISLVTPVSTKNLKAGDVIQYKMAEDVMQNGLLLFGQGAPGEGVVTKVTPAKNFGRDAKIEIDFKHVRAFDGTEVETFLGEEAKKEMKSMAMAAGASVAGMVILGPIGIVTGAFVNGNDIDLPAGTQMYIQTKTNTVLYAIQPSVK